MTWYNTSIAFNKAAIYLDKAKERTGHVQADFTYSGRGTGHL